MRTLARAISLSATCLPLLLLASLTTAAVGSEPVDAYFAKAIWLGTGDESSGVIQDAVLVTESGRIKAVGKRGEVNVPATARRHDLGNSVLIPGLVIAQSNRVKSANSDEYAVQPGVRAIDGFDPFDDYQSLLAAGVTTLQVSPADDRLIPGQTGVVRLTPDSDEATLVDSESLRVILSATGRNPPSVYEPPVGAVSVDRPLEPTRPQLATSLTQAVVGLDALLAEAVAIAQGKATQDLGLSALADLLEQRTTIRWSANSNAEVRAALRLASRYELPWIIEDPQEVDALIARETWESPWARGVLLNPEFRPGRITNPVVPSVDVPTTMPVWQRARKLKAAGIGNRLAIYAGSDADIEDLLFSASIFARGGFDRSEILQMLTANPAQIMGINDQVGALKPDALADFVVLSDTPLQAGTTVQATYVGGQLVYSADQSGRAGRETTDDSALILAKSIYTPSGIIENGKLSVRNGKISGVGTSISQPSHCERFDFGDAVIIPGMVDCSTTIGIGGSLNERLSLGTKLGELLAREDEQVAVARQGGVTAALLSSSRLPSPVLAFKLSDSPRPLKDPVAIRFEISGNLTEAETKLRSTLQSGKSYAEAWDKYDNEFAEYEKKLKVYEQEKKEYDAAVKAAEEKKAETQDKSDDAEKSDSNSKDSRKEPKPSEEPDGESDADQPENGSDKKQPAKKSEQDSKAGDEGGASQTKGGDDKQAAEKAEESPAELQEPTKPEEPKKPRFSEDLEPYRPLFAKEIVALVELDENRAVEVAVKLFRKDFDLKTGIVGGKAAAKYAETLRDEQLFAIVGPQMIGNEEGQPQNYAADLAIAGVPFGFQSKASTGVKELSDAVSYAVHGGLGSSDALNALTTAPLNFLGIDSLGSLQAGADADLVVLSGPPFELSSEVLAVMIDGKWVYQRED
ncbi:MAG: amidohydrolase family protein [bacterium]|nr:amidohydrolase family protein [bacterium]